MVLSAAMRLISGATKSSGSDAASVTPDFLSCSWIFSLTSMGRAALFLSSLIDYLTRGPAAMTSTSTRNSGREKPLTIIRVDAGGGSLTNWSRAAI